MGKEEDDIKEMLKKEIEWQHAVEKMMEEISSFEKEKHKPIGLKISAMLNSYLIANNKEEVGLCSKFLARIHSFVETNGGTVEVLVSRLLEKTSRLGCLQTQNHEHFPPGAKLTHG